MDFRRKEQPRPILRNIPRVFFATIRNPEESAAWSRALFGLIDRKFRDSREGSKKRPKKRITEKKEPRTISERGKSVKEKKRRDEPQKWNKGRPFFWQPPLLDFDFSNFKGKKKPTSLSNDFVLVLCTKRDGTFFGCFYFVSFRISFIASLGFIFLLLFITLRRI